MRRTLLLVAALGLAACSGGGGGGGGGGNPAIAGTVRAAPGTMVDSDLGDVHATPVSNDTAGAAQQLPDGVTVGGWVAVITTAVDPEGVGTHDVRFDPQDWYSTTLAAGEPVRLDFDRTRGDLSLELYASNGTTLLDSASFTDPAEVVSTAAGGAVYVRVVANWGGSTYLLRLGSGASAGSQSAGALDAAAPFLPGQVIVRFRDDVPGASPEARAAKAGLVHRHGANGHPMLAELGQGAARAATFKALGIEKHLDDDAALDPDARLRRDTIRVVRALRQRADVVAADPNYVVHASAITPNDPYYPQQWHYAVMHLPEAWGLFDPAVADSGVSPAPIVAVVDTGIYATSTGSYLTTTHPDLMGKLVAGYDFVSDITGSYGYSIAADGDGCDPYPQELASWYSDFHGTHVAGTIGAKTGNGIGVAGVSWGAKIMPVRALGFAGEGSVYDILTAIQWAGGILPQKAGDTCAPQAPARRADVINLSLGGGPYMQTAQAVYDALHAAGVVVVAAAGNDNVTDFGFPASYRNVISVSAVGPDLARASYSNYGFKIDLAAPGGDVMLAEPDGATSAVASRGVLSTWANESGTGYGWLQGTSMASPHVAGVVALMKSKCPTLTPAQVDGLLAAGLLTDDLGPPGRDNVYGYGLVDAWDAVLAASTYCGFPAPSVIDLTPGLLDLAPSTATTTLRVNVARIGTEPLVDAVTVTTDAGWITAVAPESVDAEGVGTYAITVSTAGLATGLYQGAVTFRAGKVTETVAISLRAGGAAGAWDAGPVQVYLFGTNWSPRQVSVRKTSPGVYPYSFAASGSWYVLAGTDLDGDGWICGPGEPCGGYPDLDALATAPVGSKRDFLVGFDVPIAPFAAGASKGYPVAGVEPAP